MSIATPGVRYRVGRYVGAAALFVARSSDGMFTFSASSSTVRSSCDREGIAGGPEGETNGRTTRFTRRYHT
ncbi:MAG TPA: hypothetical protein VJ925_06565 [Longimicrobiales bacterium]|nr:hypothetical protein [Longimicrobiales bacterium]